MTDIVNPTFDVTAGEGDEATTFTFRVPTPLDKAKIGIREASIRRQLDPVGGGWAIGLDDETFFLIRGMALLEVLLTQADARWPFDDSAPAGKNASAEVRVNIEKFPAGKETIIAEVGRQFQDALDRFHGRGVEHSHPDVPEVVAGSVDPKAL